MRLAPCAMFAALALAGTARADPDPVAEEPPTSSYRGYTLAADAASIALLGAGLANNSIAGHDTSVSAGLMLAGLLGGTVLAPIIHGARGHGGRAFGSLVLRTAAISGGAALGIATASCTGQQLFCGLDRVLPGALGGLVVASLIDAAFLTDEPVDSSSRWAPIVAPRPGGGTIGFAARF